MHVINDLALGLGTTSEQFPGRGFVILSFWFFRVVSGSGKRMLSSQLSTTDSTSTCLPSLARNSIIFIIRMSIVLRLISPLQLFQMFIWFHVILFIVIRIQMSGFHREFFIVTTIFIGPPSLNLG